MKLLEQIRENAKKQQKTIVLPEGTEERTLQAADQVIAEGIARIILIGKPEEIHALAEKHGLKHIAQATIIDPENHAKKEAYADLLVELRKNKGMTKEQAQSYIKAWQISNTAKGSSGGSGGSGGGSSGGGTTTPQVTTPGDPTTIYKTLYRLGYRTKEDAYAYLIDQDYSSTEADNLSSMFEDKVENGDFEVGGMSSDYFRAFAQSLTSRLGSGRVEQALNDVNRWWGSMSFAQQVETEKILSRYGYSIQ